MFKPLTFFNRNCNAPALRDENAIDPFFQLHREMNRMFDDFFTDFGAPSHFSDRGSRGARPAHINVKETDKNVKIEVELPGVSEDDIHVELKDNFLTIKGEKRIEKDEDDNGRSARAYSSFQRSMSLPFEIDADAVDATFKNGVLKIILTKPPEIAARATKIEVRRG